MQATRLDVNVIIWATLKNSVYVNASNTEDRQRRKQYTFQSITGSHLGNAALRWYLAV